MNAKTATAGIVLCAVLTASACSPGAKGRDSCGSPVSVDVDGGKKPSKPKAPKAPAKGGRR